jgi:hypothetical protein
MASTSNFQVATSTYNRIANVFNYERTHSGGTGLLLIGLRDQSSNFDLFQNNKVHMLNYLTYPVSTNIEIKDLTNSPISNIRGIPGTSHCLIFHFGPVVTLVNPSI